MISNIFHYFFFDPLYNILMALSVFLPGHSLGGAIIILTLIVKFILLPFQHQALKTQKRIKSLEPHLQKLKKRYSADKPEQARKTMELYKAHGVNPLTTFWTILVQIPIILALFWVFRDSVTLHPDLLYSFVPRPDAVVTSWLGLDLSKSFLPLSLLVGLSQFFQLWLATPPQSPPAAGRAAAGDLDPKQEFARKLQGQMRYGLPVFIVFISHTLPAAISLYWITSNLFAVAHELIIRRQAGSLTLEADKVAPTNGR